MPEFGKYITPQEAQRQNNEDNTRQLPLEYFVKLSERVVLCSSCEQNIVWRLSGTFLCFSCLTGEHDASNDIELLFDGDIKK